MSTTETRMPLETALALAERLVGELRDACGDICIAGSIRRRSPTVGDLEIVCVPKTETVYGGLFGDQEETADLLDARVWELWDQGVVAPRLDKNGRKAVGKRYRRLLYHDAPLDLFSPAAESYGAILAIRTGPAEFSHRLVTPKGQGGLMPEHLQMRDGSLRYRVSGEAIPIPTEEAFFAALGLPWLDPPARGPAAGEVAR